MCCRQQIETGVLLGCFSRTHGPQGGRAPSWASLGGTQALRSPARQELRLPLRPGSFSRAMFGSAPFGALSRCFWSSPGREHTLHLRGGAPCVLLPSPPTALPLGQCMKLPGCYPMSTPSVRTRFFYSRMDLVLALEQTKGV